MSDGLVGKRVAWAHRDAEGARVLDIDGEVLAVSLSAERVWHALILLDDGTMVSHLAKDLEVVEVLETTRGLIAGEDLRTLEAFIAETFPNHGEADEHVVDHAIRLLTELRETFVKVITERDDISRRCDALIVELNAAKKKLKPRGGAKGPGESGASDTGVKPGDDAGDGSST